jgi:hypothetical protein
MDTETYVKFPALRRLKGKTLETAYPITGSSTTISAECDEELRYPYCVVIRNIKVPGVKYILAEDDDNIYIQYGWEGMESEDEKE